MAWACANHQKDKESYSQKYITDDALKLAFVTMMNKLVFGHQLVLCPLLQSLRGLNDQSRLLKIEELETAIEKNREQKHCGRKRMVDALRQWRYGQDRRIAATAPE